MTQAIVTLTDGRAVADSRHVAVAFSRRHDHVLRDIDGLVATVPELRPRFGEQFFSYAAGNGAQRQARRFDMDRSGFMLLVMGFGGEKAIRLKMAWIDAFDAMEAALTSPANDIAVLGEDVDRFRAGLQLVREARILGGRAAGRRAWTVARLPDVFCESVATPALLDAGGSPIAAWFAARVERLAGVRTSTGQLYDDYRAWCADRETDAVTMSLFGRLLNQAGIAFINSNGIKRIGVRLRGVHV